MSPAWTTFLFEAVNFLILAGVLGWLLFNPVRNALEARRAALQQQADDAAARLAEAQKLQDEARRRREAFEQELDQLRSETRAAAEKEAESIRAAGRAAADREREAVKQDLAGLEQAQLARLGESVAVAAGAVVGKLLQSIAGPELDAALIRAACRELQSLDGRALGQVTVESSSPLDGESKAALDAALGEAAGGAEYRVVPNLGSGVRIRTAGGLVDATTAGLADYAQRGLAERIVPGNNGNQVLNPPGPESAAASPSQEAPSHG